MTYFKVGSFSSVSLLGTAKEVKPFVSKKDSKNYTVIVVQTAEKYTTKEGEEKSLESLVRVYAEGTLSIAVGNVVLVEGEVGTANVSFKTETKYPVTQVVVTGAKVQKVAEVASDSFSGMNSFELIGRVGRQLREIKDSKGCDFAVAISPKGADTLWIPIVFWGQRGVKLIEIVNKGDLVRIIGRGSLTTKKVGEEEKQVLSLFGTDLQFLSKKKNEEESTEESTETVEQTAIEDDPEDAPF